MKLTSSIFKLVKISSFTLEKHGAISAEFAKEMAANIQQLLNTYLAISFTSNADPTNQENKAWLLRAI